jgi:hypothetical protein
VSPRKNIAVQAVCWLWNGVKEHWKKTSFYVLAAALASALFSFWNYRLQRNANEPKLISTNPTIALNAQPKIVVLNLENIGKQAARRGIARLFVLNPDGTRGQKLGEAPIVGAGTNVVTHGSAQFRFDDGSYDRFLTCVTYYDDSNEVIPQAFAFRIGKIDSNPETTLDEIEQPDYRQVCD